MKPTDQQISDIALALHDLTEKRRVLPHIRRLFTSGTELTEIIIEQWEAIRPPDPAPILQAEEIDLLRKNCDRAWQAHTNLLREYHALHDAFSKFKSPDPAPTVFPDPPHGWEWHNPENLTPEILGRGWRLRCVGETAERSQFYGKSTETFYAANITTLTPDLTYRTKDPLPDPKPTAEEIAPLNIDLVRPFLERYAEFGAAERISAAEMRESEARNQTPKP